MTTYKHVTGKERAANKFFGVDLEDPDNQHPARPDFVDDSVIMDDNDLTPELMDAGVPVPEDASDTAKADQKAAY